MWKRPDVESTPGLFCVSFGGVLWGGEGTHEGAFT